MKTECTQKQVLEFLALTDTLAICLDGGWGVDALLGKQTRQHSDLDIIIGAQELVELIDILVQNAYREDATQQGSVFVSGSGMKLDIHVIRFDERGYGIFDLGEGRTWPLPPSAFQAQGVIGDRPVTCLSAEAQVACHAQGYTPTQKDLSDMQALQRKFDVVLPISLGAV